MPRLIVAGIGKGVLRQAGYSEYEPEIDGWEVIFCHSADYKSKLDSCWDEALAAADSSPESGAHIVASHNARSERKKFAAEVYARHRLTWLGRTDILQYGTEAFTNLLKSIAAFEERWRDQVRPSDTNAPLVLPETFVPLSGLKDTWRWAQNVERESGDLKRLSRQLVWFSEKHCPRDVWTDTRKLIYSGRGARHGGFHDPIGRRWKFTLLVPLGFHFDVRHQRNIGFTLRDEYGVERTYRQRANVSCHGHLWGGR